ncbi:MAG: hypothetical protein IJ306_04065 [Oscillospiraceae bacterium]|nr:hypothetical protein [Oscillospiraceae bacterium]
MKKFLAILLTMVLTAGVAISGTVAYLQDQDSDVNVMTIGNVKIEQHEYERVVNEDGTLPTETIDGKTSYLLQDFTQAKPLVPSAINTTTWEGWDYDSTTVRMTQVDSYGGMQVFYAASNAQDKFVTVENTGKTDAYIRTIVAIECGEGDANLVGSSFHLTWTNNQIGIIEVDGNKYYMTEYVYNGAEGVRHENGVLPAGDTSYPNLSQVYLHSKATNEDCEALDGNDNGTLDILVVSQAVQAEGFDDAETALNAAFGDITKENHPWVGEGKAPVIPTYVSTMTDLEAALAEGGEVNLTADIAIPEGEQINVPVGSTATLNLNGHTITSESKSYGIRNEGNLTITNGTVEGAFGALGCYGDAVCFVENATLISDGYPASSSHAIYTSGNSKLTLDNVTVNHKGGGADGSVLYAAGSSNVVINSGNFTWSGTAYNLAAAGTSTVTIDGGTFQNNNFFIWGGTITDNRTNG